ncbi:MAG: hypothetical protein RIQ94_3118 [Pseudomonadota bacterium]
MERRDFIRLSTVGIVAGVVTPTMVLANADKPVKGTSDIYYTKEDAGRWSGKVATHLPSIDIEKVANVVYIVKHVLLDSHHKFLDEHLFDPTKDSAALSTFTLKDYSGTLYVLSLCNKHDLWLNSAEV